MGKSLLHLLFPAVRAEVLRLLFTHRGQELYVRQIAQLSFLSLHTVQDELAKLAAAAKQGIAEAKVTLKANEADLALVKRDLVNAKLYAPSTGVIQDRLLEAGDMASPERPVFTLALDDPVWIRANISGTDLEIGLVRLHSRFRLEDGLTLRRYFGFAAWQPRPQTMGAQRCYQLIGMHAVTFPNEQSHDPLAVVECELHLANVPISVKH